MTEIICNQKIKRGWCRSAALPLHTASWYLYQKKKKVLAVVVVGERSLPYFTLLTQLTQNYVNETLLANSLVSIGVSSALGDLTHHEPYYRVHVTS